MVVAVAQEGGGKEEEEKVAGVGGVGGRRWMEA